MKTTPAPLELARVRALTSEGKARRIRLRSQLSLSEIATEVGVTPAAIQRWEMGLRLPRGKPAVRYLQLLEKLGQR